MIQIQNTNKSSKSRLIVALTLGCIVLTITLFVNMTKDNLPTVSAQQKGCETGNPFQKSCKFNSLTNLPNRHRPENARKERKRTIVTIKNSNINPVRS